LRSPVGAPGPGVDWGIAIVSAIILIAVGAILKWAITAHVSWINLETAGTVLFVLGLVALALAIAYTFYWSGRRRAPVAEDPYYDRRPPGPTDTY
jgi:hypothetical protein